MQIPTMLFQTCRGLGIPKSSYKSILRRLVRLYVDKLYLLHLAPVPHQVRDEFRSVIHSYLLWFASSLYQVIEHQYYPAAFEREADLHKFSSTGAGAAIAEFCMYKAVEADAMKQEQFFYEVPLNNDNLLVSLWCTRIWRSPKITFLIKKSGRVIMLTKNIIFFIKLLRQQ